MFKNTRDENTIKDYADSKFDLDDTLIPNYMPYLQKHIEYSKRFNPKLSHDAKFMLKEHYISIAKEYGSPRVRETIITIAKMIAQLKLKSVVDVEDVKETVELYNVILQQLSKIVNVTTNPSDETFECCLNILRESSFAILFENVVKSACDKNARVRYFIRGRFKLRETSKLRPIAERLRRHSHIVTVSENPLVLRWDESGGFLPLKKAETGVSNH